METLGQGKPKEGQKERIAEIRKKIAKYEESGDEAEVLELEAELRAIERGEEFDQEKYLESLRKPEALSIEPPRYEYFGGDLEIIKSNRDDIFTYSKGMAEYALKHRIQNIVFMDRAARPAWVGVDEYWEQKLKDKPKPGFYFINSDAFITREFYKWNSVNSEPGKKKKGIPSEMLFDEEVLEQLGSKYKYLLKFKNKPVLLFDTCSHTGDTLLSVKRMFQMAGFTDVRTATASVPEKYSGVKSVIKFDDANLNLCNPFGLERAVSDDWTSISSVPAGGEEEKNNSRSIRRDIRQIIQERV